MTDSTTIRPSVMAFAALMEEKLVQRESKGGWEGVPPSKLLGLLRGEVEELHEEIYDGTRDLYLAHRIAYEAADVANYAMMICDNIGMLQ